MDSEGNPKPYNFWILELPSVRFPGTDPGWLVPPSIRIQFNSPNINFKIKPSTIKNNTETHIKHTRNII